ncbi:MAG TPA: sigma factor-like helix-turn-helix DNA-binding protein [Polyangiaceae bacterium]|nr:sigma factor-like helix-turn-helix DNA-binding protein [Polyangiaceae bacterium]
MDHATARDLARRIAALRPDLRDALLFVDVLGLSPRDAAARVGVALPTLLGRLRSARASLAGGCP